MRAIMKFKTHLAWSKSDLYDKPRELWILGVVNCGGNDDADDGELGLAVVGDSLGLS